MEKNHRTHRALLTPCCSPQRGRGCAALGLGALLLVLGAACGVGEDGLDPGRPGGGGAEGAGGAIDADAAGGGPGGPVDPSTICRSASALDIFDAAGAVDKTRYAALAAAFSSAPAVGYRFGHDATHYHPSPEVFPPLYKPDDKVRDNGPGNPKSVYQIGGPTQSDPGGYNSSGGQVLYVPDDAQQVGADYIEFLSVVSNVVSEKPQLSWANYGGGRPEIGLDSPAGKTAHGGPFQKPIAVARAVSTDTQQMDAIFAFQDGTLVTTGTHSSGGSSTVMTRLPAGLVPTAIALTTNSELALVTVWDPANVRGGLAVVALGGPADPGFWGDWKQLYPGLLNHGLVGFIKVLGVVWIPDMVAPIAVSALADVRNPMLGAPERNTISLSDEATRQRFVPGGDLSMRYAQSGFAVVLSRSEKKVAFIDLQPTFAYFNRSYFGTRAAFDATRTMGQGPKEFPSSFDEVADARPTVVKVETFTSCPTAVTTHANVFRPNNFVDANDQDRRRDPPPGFAVHAIVGTEDGTLHAFAVGGLNDSTKAEASAIKETGTIAVGRNPTSISPLDLTSHTFDHPLDYVVVSRGDRRVDFLRGAATTGALSSWKTLRDSRLVDPVHVNDVGYFGNVVPLVAISDYAGKQLVEYRYRPIVLPFYQNQKFGMGADGKAEFECGGAYSTPGGALFSTAANIP